MQHPAASSLKQRAVWTFWTPRAPLSVEAAGPWHLLHAWPAPGTASWFRAPSAAAPLAPTALPPAPLSLSALPPPLPTSSAPSAPPLPLPSPPEQPSRSPPACRSSSPCPAPARWQRSVRDARCPPAL
eukprot:70153-Rhodomonas_salina.2